MRNLPIVALLAVVSAAACARSAPTKANAPQALGEEVQIGTPEDRVGQIVVHHEETITHLEGKLHRPNGEIADVALRSAETETRREEVLAVEGKRWRALRVTYAEKATTKTSDGGVAQKASSVVAGKTYVVERSAQGVRVHDAAGAEVDPSERKIVLEHYVLHPKKKKGSGGKGGGAKRRTMHVGERVDDMVDELLGAMPEGMDAEDAQILLRRLVDPPEGRAALFEISVLLKGTDEGVTMSGPAEGSMLVRLIDGADLNVKLHADLELSATGPQGTLSAKGTFDVSEEATFQ